MSDDYAKIVEERESTLDKQAKFERRMSRLNGPEFEALSRELCAEGDAAKAKAGPLPEGARPVDDSEVAKGLNELSTSEFNEVLRRSFGDRAAVLEESLSDAFGNYSRILEAEQLEQAEQQADD